MDQLATKVNITFLFKPKKEFSKISVNSNFVFPLLLSLSLLITSLAISIMFYDYSTNIFMEQKMEKNESLLAFVAGSLLTLLVFAIEITLLATYLFLSIKIFNHYSTFKECISLVIFVSVVKSFGQVLEAVNSSQSLFKIPTNLEAILNNNWFLEGLFKPLELFNIWSLILLFFGLKQISKLSYIKISIIIGFIVILDAFAGVSWSYIVDIFSIPE